ncbi:hypothetical protein, partial [Sphingomonas koreensis]|uniref:hypothetical protein n=1 Tax=Sphingomonas koreensis TaxID=93064 RepID=UPI0019D07B4F
MRIRSVLLAATALAAALPAHAQHSRLDALERRLAEQQARIEQLEALVARQSAQGDKPVATMRGRRHAGMRADPLNPGHKLCVTRDSTGFAEACQDE